MYQTSRNVHCGVLERYIALLHDLPAYSRARELLIATVRAHQANPDLPAFTEPARHISRLLLEEHLRRWETSAAPHRDAAQDAIRRVGTSSGSVLVARQTVQVHLDSVTELLEQSPQNGALLAQRRALQDLLSHETALALHDLSDALPAKVHMTLPASWRRRRLRVPAGLVLHYADIGNADRTGFSAVPITSTRKTLRDCIEANVSPELVRQAVLQARRRGLISEKDGAELNAALDRTLGSSR